MGDVEPGQRAEISVIDTESTEEASIVSLVGRRLRLVTQLALEPWTPVQVDWPDCLILGEVLGHETGAGSETVIVIRVVHAFDVGQLNQQRRHWF
jgi:hypothetical protein